MRFEALKVGELARRTGLTIRTLHHYDEISELNKALRKCWKLTDNPIRRVCGVKAYCLCPPS